MVIVYGGGVSTNIKNVSGTVINPSTEEKQDNIITKLDSVTITENTTDSIMAFVAEYKSTTSSVNNITRGDYSFTATAGHGIVVGNCLCFYEDTKYTQLEVVGVSGDVISISGMFDYNFTTNVIIKCGNNNLAVDGSVTPVEFCASLEPFTDNVNWHITHISFHIEDNVVMDDSLFGSLSRLTNGVVGIAKNIQWHNLFIVRSNGGIKLRSDFFAYSDKAPAGFYGFTGIKRLGGLGNNGTIVELHSATDDKISVIIRDKLDDLSNFRIMIHGHKIK